MHRIFSRTLSTFYYLLTKYKGNKGALTQITRLEYALVKFRYQDIQSKYKYKIYCFPTHHTILFLSNLLLTPPISLGSCCTNLGLAFRIQLLAVLEPYFTANTPARLFIAGYLVTTFHLVNALPYHLLKHMCTACAHAQAY